MANSIALAIRYLPILQMLYKQASVTSVLDTNPAMIRDGDAAGTVLLPKRTLVGLGAYSKTDGAPAGDVTLEWVSKTLAYDRGRSFSVDAVDNMETMDVAFGGLFNDFMTSFVSPEVDAVRIARYATGAKAAQVISGTPTKTTISGLIDDATAALDEENVTKTGRYLFITNAMYKLLKQGVESERLIQGTSVDRNVTMFDDLQVVRCNASIMYTAITCVSSGFIATVGGPHQLHGCPEGCCLPDRQAREDEGVQP